MKNPSDNDPLAATQRVLITGASSGIGLSLARLFASRGHPLVIVAPDEDELDGIAAEIEERHGVAVLPIAMDLTEDGAVEELANRLGNDELEVEIVVNNAGLGIPGNFWETDFRDIETMIRLNILAVASLTHQFLPEMVRRGHGRILHTASIAGFEPAAGMAAYHATKAFVLSLSESIATELEGTGVTLTALCPGPVDTDFFTKADLVDSKAFQSGNVMAPQDVAEAAYDALMRGERTVIPGTTNKALVFSRRFLTESAEAGMGRKNYETQSGPRKRERGDEEKKAAAKGKP